MKGGTRSSQKPNWVPCGGCNDCHLLRSRLDNGHAPTGTCGRTAQESAEEIVSNSRDLPISRGRGKTAVGASVRTPTTRD